MFVNQILCACLALTADFLKLLSCSSSLSANSRVEPCRTDDLMPNVPPSRVDPEVQGL